MEEKKITAISDDIRETLYRSGYLTQILGFLFVLTSFFLNSDYQIRLFGLSGYLIIAMGIITSAIFLRIKRKQLKAFIVVCSLLGFVGLLGAFILDQALIEQIFFGISLVGLAALLGKEAHCFNFFEGRIMMLLLPLLAVVNIFSSIRPVESSVQATAWMVCFLVFAFFIFRKASTPLNNQPSNDNP